MPMRLSEGPDAALGYIQAFNVKTGKIAWVFKTIPHPGEDGYDTWPKEVYKNTSGVGAANNWSGMSIDRERGMIYVPTGSAADDFYGANRIGSNLFANTLLALDAKTGKWEVAADNNFNKLQINHAASHQLPHQLQTLLHHRMVGFTWVNHIGRVNKFR